MLEVRSTVDRMHLKCHRFVRQIKELGSLAREILERLPEDYDVARELGLVRTMLGQPADNQDDRNRIMEMAKEEIEQATNLCRGNASLLLDIELEEPPGTVGGVANLTTQHV